MEAAETMASEAKDCIARWADKPGLPAPLVDLAPHVCASMADTLAAVMNAHMQPIVARYQAAFAAQSVRQEIPNRPPIMLSNGGVVGASLAGA